MTFHTLRQLRQTFASQMVMAGVHLLTVSKLMGHASIEMTQRCASISPDHKTWTMTRLEEFLPEKDGIYLAPAEGDGKAVPVTG